MNLGKKVKHFFGLSLGKGANYNVPQKLDSDLRRIWDGFEEQKPWNVGVKYVLFRKGVYDESTQAL